MIQETKVKHTPGPWTIKEQVQKLPGGETVRDYHVFSGHDFICTSWPPQEVLFSIKHPDPVIVDQITEANAKLIAAGPELLEALQYAVDTSDMVPSAREKALQAIKKATE